MVLFGIDRSHWNAEPDFAAFKAAGGAFVICKATDGVGYKDLSFDACRAGTESVGLVFGSYHFAEWGNPVSEAQYYLSVATPRPGELVALDAESAIPAGVDVVAWSATFSKVVHDATGAWPLLYMNQNWLAGHNWASVAATDGLWLAKYDGLPTGGPIGQWPVMAMKQFTDSGVRPGVPGQIDVDAFQGDLAALLRYAVPRPGPGPAPQPIPTPAPAQEEDMPPCLAFRNDPAQKDTSGKPGDGSIALAAPGFWYQVSSAAYFNMQKARGWCGDYQNVPPNEYAFQRLFALSGAPVPAATPVAGLSETQVEQLVVKVLSNGTGSVPPTN